jgi:hypothetical protein
MLSALFADKLRMDTVQIERQPNLYGFILGESNTFKTSLNRIISRVIRNIDEQIPIGEPSTPSGLEERIKVREGKSIYAFSDEIQDFYSEINNQKFKTGIVGALTRAYDSTFNPQVQRNNGSDIKPISCCFTFMMMGVGSKFTENTKSDKLGTGFLERFIYAYQEPTNTKEVIVDTEFDNSPKSNIKWIDRVSEITSEMSLIVNGLQDPTWMYVNDTNVRGLISAGKTKISNWHIDSPISPSACGKLSENFVRACMLLSACKHEVDITEETVLQCLEQTEMWADSLIRLYKNLEQNPYTAKLNEVLAWLGEYPEGVSLTEYRRHFSKWNTEHNMNIAEMIKDSLVLQKFVTYTKAASKIILVEYKKKGDR